MGLVFAVILGGLSAGSIFILGYKLWIMAVLGMLWLMALVVSALGGHHGFGGHGNTDVMFVIAGALITAAIIIPNYNAQKPCYQGRMALKKLVESENEYFAKNKAFTTNIDLLNFENSPHFFIRIPRGDEKSFVVAVAHLSCDENNDGTPDVLMWDSARGGHQ